MITVCLYMQPLFATTGLEETKVHVKPDRMLVISSAVADTCAFHAAARPVRLIGLGGRRAGILGK